MASSNTPQGVDNTFRKKFDTEEYRERAREREKKEAERSKQSKGPPVQRAPLKHRDYHVDLESRLGKTQVVTPVAPLSQQAGYFCRVCDCVVKDSANYLDHINGKKHQRALGMSMRVERSSLEQVQERFEVLKKRKTPGTFSEQDLDERIRKQQEEEEEYKRQRREKKKEKKKGKVVEEEPEMDPEVAEMMGFGRRELRPEDEKSPGGSLRRSLRVSKRGVSDAAGKEKSPPCSSAKPAASTPSSCSLTLRRSPRFSSGGGGGGSLFNLQSGNSVLSSCSSTKSVSLKKDGVRSSRSRPRSKTKQMSRDCNDGEEGVSVCLTDEKGNGVRSKDRSRSRPCPNTKQICIDCDCYDHDDEEGVSLCLGEVKRMKLSNENDNDGKRIIDKEEGLKKTKNERGGWTEELELALQGAYLTAKPSPHFWKNVSKMVPGKSAQECFDRVNADLITPRQTQPRSRAKKSNLSPIPRFSLSASKLLKPISPTKAKTRQRKGNLSKKAIRHLVEKQNHMDQGLGFDLFSVLEPGAASSFLSTPTEKGKSLPRIIESPVMPGSSKDQANLVSPPVLKQVKNKALHEKYIDHLHVREAKRKAEYNRLVGKENVRPVDNQMNVRAAKDALYFDVQDAVQKLKGLETENSSSSSEFCYGLGETDEEDESI